MADDLHETIMALEPELRLIYESYYSDSDRSAVVAIATFGFLECRARAAKLTASAPLFNWRRVEDEEGDGPFLGWSEEWEAAVTVFAREVGDRRIWFTDEFGRRGRGEPSEEYGCVATGLTHVCDFHAPEEKK